MPQARSADSDPSSGYEGLVRNTKTGLQRLLAMDAPDLHALAERFQANSADVRPAGPDAMATWPADVRALADRL